MRFLKVIDRKLGKDILHIWIEDYCGSELEERVEQALLTPDGEGSPYHDYEVVIREYEKEAEVSTRIMLSTQKQDEAKP